jgi:hypothetical protein
MSWWIFGLSCGLALQSLVTWRLVKILNQRILQLAEALRDALRSTNSNLHTLDKAVTTVCYKVSMVQEGIKMLGAIDVGVLRDCGWLILVSRVGGQDWVKLQELAPMSLQEYRALVDRLKELGTEFKYVDGPLGAVDFLKEKRR